MNQNESQEDFYFGLFLVKKIDHKLLFEAFKRKFINSPTNPQISIDLGTLIPLLNLYKSSNLVIFCSKKEA